MQDPLLADTYPAQAIIKVFGLTHDDFEIAVYSIMLKHFPQLAENALHARQSKQGKYLAISVTVEAQSKEQLEAVYQELSQCPHVLTTL